MPIPLSKDTQHTLSLLHTLCDSEIITWPIDFEACQHDEEDLNDALQAWLGSDRWQSSGSQFLQLGQDASGSLFMLWHYPGLSLEPPVVFMGSEGDTAILAPSLGDFMRQLASQQFFFSGDWVQYDESELQALNWPRLKAAIAAHLPLDERKPEAIQQEAERLHPAFGKWIQTYLDY